MINSKSDLIWWIVVLLQIRVCQRCLNVDSLEWIKRQHLVQQVECCNMAMQITEITLLFAVPSVLLHWKEEHQNVKIEWRGVHVVIHLKRGADCLYMVQLMPMRPKTPLSLASFKSRLVLPCWYWPLNGCSSSSTLLFVQGGTGKSWTNIIYVNICSIAASPLQISHVCFN